MIAEAPMRLPRFRLRALMIAVAVVGVVFAGIAAVTAHYRAETEAGLVLRSNYWIEVTISPLGWMLLPLLAIVAAGTIAAIARTIRKG
jgi:hypothetical protein